MPFAISARISRLCSAARSSSLGPVQWFAEYQPFHARHRDDPGAADGHPVGNDGVIAVAWCLALGLAGYLSAKRLFRRDPTP